MGRFLCAFLSFFSFFLFFPRPLASLSCLHWLPICSTKLSCIVNIVRIYEHCSMCAWNNLFSFSFFSVSLQRAAWRVELWVQTATGSSLNSATDMLCDLGRVHFSLLPWVLRLYYQMGWYWKDLMALQFYDLTDLSGSSFSEEEDCEKVHSPFWASVSLSAKCK